MSPLLEAIIRSAAEAARGLEAWRAMRDTLAADLADEDGRR